MQNEQSNAPRTAPVLNLFAKLPIKGQVKTRLIPSVGVDEATRLAERFITYTLAETTRLWPGDRVLWLAPHTDHPLVESLRQQFDVEVCRQVEGDLGDKMVAALNRDLDQGIASAVMGCDLVHCPPQCLIQAGHRLAEGENVFGMADDGGFWLLGLTRSAPRIFEGVDWDAGNTGAASLAQAASLGVRFNFRAPELFDIDRPDDLDRLRCEYPEIWAQLGTTPNGTGVDGNNGPVT